MAMATPFINRKCCYQDANSCAFYLYIKLDFRSVGQFMWNWLPFTRRFISNFYVLNFIENTTSQFNQVNTWTIFGTVRFFGQKNPFWHHFAIKNNELVGSSTKNKTSNWQWLHTIYKIDFKFHGSTVNNECLFELRLNIETIIPR